MSNKSNIFKQTYRNFVFRDYILSLALYTVQCTYVSLNSCGIKFTKLIIVWNISNLFLYYWKPYLLVNEALNHPRHWTQLNRQIWSVTPGSGGNFLKIRRRNIIVRCLQIENTSRRLTFFCSNMKEIRKYKVSRKYDRLAKQRFVLY